MSIKNKEDIEMKKVFLFIVLSFISFISFSQVEEINGKKYILPDAISTDGCKTFDGTDKLKISDVVSFAPIYIDPYFNGVVLWQYDIAQLFHANDSLNIIGIAGYIRVEPVDTIVHNFLGIADTSFNILEEQVLSNTFGNHDSASYYELLFDNPVKVIGDFYVRTDFAKPTNYNLNDTMFFDSMNVKYNWNYNNWNAICGILIPYIRITERCSLKNVIMVDSTHFITTLASPISSKLHSGWKDFFDVSEFIYYIEKLDEVKGLYLFPLIGEDDDDNDTVSSVASIEVDNYTYVFPNPANENITVQSSFKIHGIEIFNEQGQKVEQLNPNGYNISIDVSSYPKGTYIAKIITKSGTANKKIIVQ